MEEPVFVRYGGRCKVVVSEFYCVGNDEGFGERIDYLETAVVLECRSDAKPISPSECPRLAFAGFVVDDHGTPARSDGCGIKVEGGVVE